MKRIHCPGLIMKLKKKRQEYARHYQAMSAKEKLFSRTKRNSI